MDKLLVSSAPFKKQASYVYIPSLLWILALVPVLVAGIIFSGENSIYTFLLAFGSYVTLEIFYIIATKQPFFINILKAFPTAMIIGMLLPPNVAIQIPILCAVLSFFVKVFFGDDNGMVVNKSAIGIVLMIAIIGIASFNSGFLGTTLGDLLRNGNVPTQTPVELLIGQDINGFIGTTCVGLCLIGGLFLCFCRLVNFRVPIMGLISFAVTIFAVKGTDFILPELCSSGVVFIFFFVATEYFTCPNNGLSGYLYGILLGVVVALFKMYFISLGEYAVLYALITCNLFVAAIDKWRPKYFGEVRKHA